MKIQSLNPATEEVIAEFEALDRKSAVGVAKNAASAFMQWKRTDIAERASLLRKLAAVLRQNKERYAAAITDEMGKPVKQATSEVEKCASAAGFYADNAERFLASEAVATDAKQSFVAFEPLGTVLAVMPWNFPFWQALRIGIPALAAGNTVVLRHSNVVPQCGLLIESAFTDAGFPKDTFRTVITDHAAVSALIKSKHVSGVSFTGSTAAGTRLAALAAKHMKKTVLELGGSDPFVVLEDADISAAAEGAAQARLMNTGQSCICAKRIIVSNTIIDGFMQQFVAAVERMRVGDPRDSATDVGPLVREAQRAAVEAQVQESVGRGAKIMTGGKRRDGKGYFYMPTVLGSATKTMRVFREEVFGPVAPVFAVKSEREAVRMANDTEYGLGASLWTASAERAQRMERELEAGMVCVNSIVRSDPRLPFGGVKKSGLGRELSYYGMREFMNVKAISRF